MSSQRFKKFVFEHSLVVHVSENEYASELVSGYHLNQTVLEESHFYPIDVDGFHKICWGRTGTPPAPPRAVQL
jgi:hypothetical protein